MKPYPIGLITVMTIFIILFVGCAPKPVIPLVGPFQPITPSDWSMWNSLSQVGTLPFLSIITIGVGVFLCFQGGAKTGIALIASGSVTLIISLTCIKYTGLIALLGLLGAIGLLVRQFYIHRKGFGELVVGVQKVKSSFVFNPEEINVAMASVQSPSTVALVKEIKNGR